MRRSLLCFVGVVTVLSGLGGARGQQPLTIKTLAVTPLVWLEKPDVDQVNFSADARSLPAQSTRVHFGPDGAIRRRDAFATLTYRSADNPRTWVEIKGITSDVSLHFDHSPDRERWAWVLDRREKETVTHIVFVGGNIVGTHTGPAAFSDIVFSPDSQHFAYAVTDGKDGFSVVRDGKKGPTHANIFFNFSSFDVASGSLTWSPDGQHLAYYIYTKSGKTEPKAAFVYDDEEIFTTGFLYASPEGQGARITFSPDSRYVVIREMKQLRSKTHIDVYDLQQRRYLAAGWDVLTCVFSPDGKRYLILMDAPQGLKKVVSSDLGEKLYEEVESTSLMFSADGRRPGWIAGNRGKWMVVIDGRESKPYASVKQLTFSPDSRRVAYAARADANGWLFVVDGGEWGPYENVEDPWKLAFFTKPHPDYPLFFSRDSRRAAWTARVGRQYQLVVDGKTEAAAVKMGTPVFSPDGRRVAVWASDGTRDFVVLDGRALPAFEEINKWQLVFSQDGEHLAYQAKTKKNWFLVVNDTPSGQAFDEIVTARLDKAFAAFPEPGRVYYLGRRDRVLYVVDEALERAPGGRP